MKTIFLLLNLMLIICICMVGCTGKSQTNNDSIGLSWMRLFLINEDIDSLISQYSYTNEMNEVMTPEIIKSIRKQLMDKHGNIVKIKINDKNELDNGYVVYAYTCLSDYNDSFIAYLSFDSGGNIAGLDFSTVIDFTMAEKGTEIKIGNNDFLLPGILLEPETPTNKLVIIIPGSGSVDLNCTLGMITPYRDIAIDLYNEGVATYRFNKRTYYAAESLDINTFTPKEELIDDVVSAVETIAEQYTGYTEIYLLGHSLGGYLLPAIYNAIQASNVTINGLIYWCANASPIEDIYLYQLETYIYDHSLNDSTEWIESLKEANETAKIIKSINVDSEYTADQLFGLNKYYYLSLKDYDPAEEASTIDIPMLFLFAENDKNVPISEMKIWMTTLSNKESASFKSYKGVDHYFVNGNGWTSEYIYEQKHVDKNVTNDISQWILKQKNKFV